ncbi:MAG: YdbH domain-containing protein [Amphritea sp.]
MRKWLLIIPLLLIVILYLILPSVAQALTRSLLAEQGITTRQIDIQYPSWNSLFIPAAEFLHTTGDQRITFSTENITIRYAAADLLLRSRLQSITVENLTANIRTSKASQESSAETFTIPALLPEEFFRQSPVDSIAVNALRITINQDNQPSIQITGDAELSDVSLAVNSEISYGNSKLPSLQFEIHNTNQLAINIGDKTQPLLQSKITLQSKTLQPKTLPSETLPSETSQTSSQQRLNIQAEHQLNLAALSELLQTPVMQDLLNSSIVLPAMQGQLWITGNSEIPVADTLKPTDLYQALVSEQQLNANLSIAQPVSEIERVALNINARLKQNDGLLKVELLTAESDIQGVNTGNKTNSQLKIKHLNIKLAPTSLSTELAPLLKQLANKQIPAINFPEFNLTISGSPIKLNTPEYPLEITYQPAILSLQELDVTQQTASGTVKIAEIQTTTPGQKVPSLAISSQFNLTSQQLENSFTLQLLDQRLSKGQLTIKGSSRTHFPEATGSNSRSNNKSDLVTTAQWKMQTLPLAGIEKVLSQYIPDLPPELVITAGELKHRGWLDLNKYGPALRLLQEVKALDGSYDQTRAFDAAWSSETLRTHRGTLTDSGKLSIGFIDIGIPIEAFSSSYRFKQNRHKQTSLQLDSSTAKFLGGTINTLPVSFDPTAPRLDTAIALTNIELAEIIALEQQPGLTGKGTMNGQMPLKFAANQLTVTDGQINSTPQGGWIKFNPPEEFLALAKINPSLNIALDALRNMQYSSLGIKLDYSADGTANFQTRFKGYNPDWNNAQPIDLSINIEENIPQLIKSLQFTDELTRTIEKRYR